MRHASGAAESGNEMPAGNCSSGGAAAMAEAYATLAGAS
jgi:hypothetical protein